MMRRQQRRAGIESSFPEQHLSPALSMSLTPNEAPLIRKGPLGLAIALLFAIPTLVFWFWKTELSEAERRFKLRDISGGHPRVAVSGSYTGGTLWKTDQTLGKLVLGETPFARCEVHSVLMERNNNNNEQVIVNDWIFMEERDSVNVLVLTKEGKFLAFQQKKYAIPGDTLAPVGGFINNDESPFDAARREVLEELGVGSQRSRDILKGQLSLHPSGTGKDANEIPFGKATTGIERDEYDLLVGKVPDDEAESWQFLGKYRTAANRGGGFVYCFLLKDAVPLVDGGGTLAYVNRGDAEIQHLHFLSLKEVQDALLEGQFQEVKWAATVALGLLHVQRESK